MTPKDTARLREIMSDQREVILSWMKKNGWPKDKTAFTPMENSYHLKRSWAIYHGHTEASAHFKTNHLQLTKESIDAYTASNTKRLAAQRLKKRAGIEAKNAQKKFKKADDERKEIKRELAEARKSKDKKLVERLEKKLEKSKAKVGELESERDRLRAAKA